MVSVLRRLVLATASVFALTVLLVGCTRTEPVTDETPAKATAPAEEKKSVAAAGPQRLTLHVPDMTEKLHLT
jgi:hypothetical protein